MTTVRTLKDVGRFSLFSTVVLQPALLGRPDRLDAEEQSTAFRLGYLRDGRVVAAFGHSVGQRLPGTKRVATRLETNMSVAAQFVDESIHVTGLCWRIPVWTPAEFRLEQDASAYDVTTEDIREFVGAAKIAFFVGGEKPFYELPLAARPMAFDAEDGWPAADGEAVRQDALGSWGQYLTDIDPYLPVGRLEKFWWEIQFPDRLPVLGGPVTVVCVIETKRSRGVC